MSVVAVGNKLVVAKETLQMFPVVTAEHCKRDALRSPAVTKYCERDIVESCVCRHGIVRKRCPLNHCERDIVEYVVPPWETAKEMRDERS